MAKEAIGAHWKQYRERNVKIAERVLENPHNPRYRHLLEWARLVLAPKEGGAVR